MFDKNVPFPEHKELSTSKLRSMAIGDSFEIEECLRSRVYQLAKQAKIKTKTALQENGMVRIWRIS